VQVTVDKVGPCEAKVTFSVPRSDFDREYQAALHSSGKKVNLKGFRQGKIPRKILEKEFGEQVRQHAIEHFMSRALDQAVEENALKPVGHERVQAEDIALDEGKDLEHSFSVSLKPDFELTEYRGLEVANELEPVMDEELEDAISDLRMQQSTPGPVGDDGIPEDGQALCRIQWVCGEETLLDREGLRLAPLAGPPGVDPEEFKQAMIGAQSGYEFELAMTIPDDFDPEEHRGKPATCTVTVNEAFSMQPPPDEELWKTLGVGSQEEFDKTARARMGEAKQHKENNRQETALLETLIEAHNFEVPEKLVENQIIQRKAQLGQEMAQGGLPQDQHEAEIEKLLPEIEAETRKSVRALFLVGAVAEKEELNVEENEMVTELQAIAQRHGAQYEQVVEHYNKNGLFQQLQIELLERKVRAFLRENAKITEP
jgi:trigger factor